MPSPISAAAQEKGRRWYKSGKRDKKTNTFRDFIACAEHLIAAGFTRKGNIVAQGGSAGGMLMGAVANMAPDLFRAIVAEVPFVDVLTTMLDDTLPLTPPEWPEWGNPIKDKQAYETIAAYSPYDRVEAKAYPHILAVGGLDRSARHLLGAGEMGGAAARAQDRSTICCCSRPIWAPAMAAPRAASTG